MHLLAENTVEIACPVTAAYQYASNLEHFGQWFPRVVAIRPANDLAHGEPGKVYLETVVIPLRGKRAIKIVVREAEHNRLLVTEGAFPPLLPRMQMQFRALSDQSCEVRWQMFSRNRGVLARLTLIPLARRLVRQRAVLGLAALKRKLEAG